ncbi:uncharacterized protein LOC123535273 [Mercenaria mercenaria]|uniref:uncharacterized protein LOC123535273 n=1 Tax=Mercenaria mercenaria TaxID=6596 RepID=UPI00234F6599|nr:uncharacterized protein LOC123535273 [Mercenaria mercenaria]
MARNRRISTSMKFAVGQGCFLFLVLVLCVGFSVTKVIVGSEYVSKCPSREMIPVYIIVSGCLPVLLSAVRQRYDSTQASEKERWSMKITLVTTVVGVMVNLAWLVAGTYLVVTTWSGTICNTPERVLTSLLPQFSTTPAPNATVKSNHANSQGILTQSFTEIPIPNATGNGIRNVKNTNKSLDQDRADEDENKVSPNNKETERKIMDNVRLKNLTLGENNTFFTPFNHTNKALVNINETKKDQTFMKGEEKTKSGASRTSNKDSLNEIENGEDVDDQIYQINGDKNLEGLINDRVSKTGKQSKNGDVSTKSVTDVERSQTKLFDTDIRINKVHNEHKYYSEFTNSSSQDKLCITCNKDILRFSLAVVVIDWVCVIFGIMYFCHFVYYRFSSIKEHILLINA